MIWIGVLGIMHRKNKSQAVFLIFLVWLVYTISYLGKLNYSANITQIIEFYDITKAQAGVVPAFFFFSYGIGQVVNGLFCKKYNIKWMVFISLFISASINLVIAVSSDFSIMKWLWLINGFALSILWPTLVRLLAEVLPQKKLATSSVVMGATVASGTLLVYGLSSIFAMFNTFKLSFYAAGFSVILVAILWLFFYNKAVKNAKKEKDQEEPEMQTKQEVVDQQHQEVGQRKLLLTSIYILCFYAIGVNLIKDGLTTWVPSILKEEFFMSDSLSILLTLFLPVLAVFGNTYALRMHKKIPDYVTHCVVAFAMIAVLVGVIIGSLTLELVSFMLVGLVAANFLASSLNSLLTSFFPLFMRGKVNSGLFAGVINGFCYLGSAISSYGLGAIADHFGWTSVFWVLIGFCFVTFLLWGGYIYLKGRFGKTKLDTTKIVDEIENIVFQWAKQHNFKKYGRTFNRVVDQDITQVIHFQNGCPEKGVSGVLWINLGIRVPECADFPNEQKKYYKEYDCNIRCRLDEYIEKKDNPYDLRENPQNIANDIIKKLDDMILPVFDVLSSRQSIIENLKKYSEFNSFRNHLADEDIELIMKHLKKRPKV